MPPHMRRAGLAGVLLLTLAAPAAAQQGLSVTDHEKDVENWRQQRYSRLKSDEGWLVVSGLFWLNEGSNPFGSAENDPVKLPAHSAKPHAGVLELAGKKVTISAATGTNLTIGGKPVVRQELRADVPGPADVVTLGDLRFFVIERDGRLGIRLRDLKSERRANFQGIEHFPVSPRYRVNAKFVPHPGDAKHTIKIVNVLGKESEMQSPGKLVFELGGQSLALDAVKEDPSDTRLFVIFRDLTAGKETYGAGRFVYTEGLPKDGQIVVDFNKAYNPPCALTPFATCPLPPPQNRLKVRIEAGEKNVKGAH
jgi:uncharacterized protein